MKKKLIYIIIAFTLFALNGVSYAGSASKSEAKSEIEEVKKIYEKLTNNKELLPFIPYESYNDGVNYHKDAVFQFSSEKEYDAAVYNAVLSKVAFETAYATAEANMFKYKLLIAERDYYKDKGKKEVLKTLIASTSLEREGKSFKLDIKDEDLFVGKGQFVLSDKGKTLLNKLHQILDLYPASRLKIIGHTSFNDVNNTKSIQKGTAIADYYTNIMGLKSDRVESKPMGNVIPVKVKNAMKPQDRIEINIIGVTDAASGTEAAAE